MSDFNFSVDDLLSNDSTAFVREQNKNLPTGQQMKTSDSLDQTSSPMLSTFTAGQIMMGVGVTDDPTDSLAKQEILLSNLLGASLNADSQDPKNTGLGVFNETIPTNLQSATQATAIQSQQPVGENTTGTSPGTGGIDPAAATDGTQLVANPNVHFQNNAGGGNLAKEDISTGKIAPNVIFVLSVLASQMSFTISCGASDLSGHRNQGHASGSLHYQFRAVDLVDLGDPKTGQSIHIASTPNSPLIRKALDIINTITGPRRPDQIISNINTGYKGFMVQADHWDHIHVGTHDWGQASPNTTMKTNPPTLPNPKGPS